MTTKPKTIEEKQKIVEKRIELWKKEVTAVAMELFNDLVNYTTQ